MSVYGAGLRYREGFGDECYGLVLISVVGLCNGAAVFFNVCLSALRLGAVMMVSAIDFDVSGVLAIVRRITPAARTGNAAHDRRRCTYGGGGRGAFHFVDAVRCLASEIQAARPKRRRRAWLIKMTLREHEPEVCKPTSCTRGGWSFRSQTSSGRNTGDSLMKNPAFVEGFKVAKKRLNPDANQVELKNLTRLSRPFSKSTAFAPLRSNRLFHTLICAYAPIMTPAFATAINGLTLRHFPEGRRGRDRRRCHYPRVMPDSHRGISPLMIID